MTSPFIIYGLHDPETEELRYIGKSTIGAQRRLNNHLRPYYLRGNSHRENWLRSLVKKGLRPTISILEEYENGDCLGEMEKLAITHYKSMGFRLVNSTDGGDGGLLGYCPSEETRKKISDAQKGKPCPSRGHPGRIWSDDVKRKMSLARLGKKRSAETLAKIKATKKARKGMK